MMAYRPFAVAIVAFLLVSLASPLEGWAGGLTPYLPPGAKLPQVALPPGQNPDPGALPKEEGKVTVQFLFRMEQGLSLDLKAFMTDPQDINRHWEEKSIPPGELDKVKVPIRGSLDTGEGAIGGPMMLKPSKALPLMTLVVDNRNGTEDQHFYIPAPNPKVDFLLSKDTKPEFLFKVVPKCLCASTVFTAPKGGVWYRVIGLYVAPEAPTPSRATFIMTVLKAPRAEGH